jgi:hypothetical protein
VAQIAAAVFRKVERRLERFVPSVQQRRFEEDAQLLFGMGEASSQGVSATGPRRGRRVLRVRGPRGEVDGVVMGRLCAQVEGFNLQAATRIAANDRGGLERMARYQARPPVANDRLTEREDGRLELRLKRPWRDGTTSLVYTPHELLERLCSLVPRPRAHLTRYHGVLAPAFAARAEIVPKGMAEIADPEPRTRGRSAIRRRTFAKGRTTAVLFRPRCWWARRRARGRTSTSPRGDRGRPCTSR